MSTKELSLSNAAGRITGWVGLAGIVFCYAALYVVNYGLPIRDMNYTSRIWNWSQIALMIAAWIILILHKRRLTTGAILL